jgi:signal transduction histidine kinase
MKKYAVALAVFFVVGFAAILFASGNRAPATPDTVALNNIAMSIARDGASTQAVTAAAGNLADLLNDMGAQRERGDSLLRSIMLIVLASLTACFALLLFSVRRRILLPFRKLDRFAKNVAGGDLEIPLEMDKQNAFGAFTESFDLMRTELSRARESERQATQSKRELVASLSHDIKTPVASIKAVAELMIATSGDEKARNQLETICTKADQIDLLISNMFSATLEELQELAVKPVEISSAVLADIIHSADYRRRVVLRDIPECLIVADSTRLSQVMDNIFANSYKYADTAINVAASLGCDMMSISISDRGRGVADEDLPLLCQKYYRGENAQGKNGTGLGLYISKYFMEKMSGSLRCENSENGFTVTLTLALA